MVDGSAWPTVLWTSSSLAPFSSAVVIKVVRIDHRQSSGRQSLRSDEVEHLEGLRGGRLRRFGVRNQGPACIGREHLRRLELVTCEHRFPSTGGTDEHD